MLRLVPTTRPRCLVLPVTHLQDPMRLIQARTRLDLPDHRRLDPRKVRVQLGKRNSNVTLTLQVLDGDDEYGARRLIHLVHEIFLTFLLYCERA